MADNSTKKMYTAGVFIVSLLIFLLSLYPGAFFVSTVDLSGTAGGSDNSLPPSNNEAMNLVIFDNGVSILSGLVSILAAIYGIQLTRSEFAKLKAVRIDDEMQRREIEKLRLELELEKRKGATKKKVATNQRKQNKKKE